MGTHPINLTLRFLLELIALFILGYWGHGKVDGWQGDVLAIALPLFAAVIWGVFAVPNDPTRSGNAPIMVSGIIRLLIELWLFGSVVWALFDLELSIYGWSLAIAVLIHYICSYDRIAWLFKQP